MNKIELYLKIPRKERNFKTGIELLKKYHKSIDKQTLEFLEDEAKKKQISGIAVGILESKLVACNRVYGQKIEASTNNENKKSDNGNEISDDENEISDDGNKVSDDEPKKLINIKKK